MSEKTTWTTKELADAATEAGRPVTQEYIRQQCKAGKLAATKPGRDWLIPDWQAKLWLESWLKVYDLVEGGE